MSIQITTAKQKVEFSKMVKDYKIRYYNLGPKVLYVDYIDSTGTSTEAVPAYSSFIVMSNAGNAANSYLNLYTSSGTTNIVVSKIQQDCAVDGTDLFGNVITAVDPADVASLLQKTSNMAASSGVTTFSGTVSAADFAAISSVSIGSVELTESSLQETENDISTLQTDVTTLKTKTQNQSATSGNTSFTGNLTVSGTISTGSMSDIVGKVKQNQSAISGIQADVSTLTLSKLSAGTLYFNQAKLFGSNFTIPNFPFSICATVRVDSWEGSTQGIQTIFQFGNNGTGALWGSICFNNIINNPGIVLRISKNTDETLSYSEVSYFFDKDTFLGKEHTIIGVCRELESTPVNFDIYVDGAKVATTPYKGLTLDSISGTVDYAVNTYNANYSIQPASAHPMMLRNLYVFNFDVSAEGAPYSIADYVAGRLIPPALKPSQVSLALENYVIERNATTKLVKDASGNSNDATVQGDGTVAGDNDQSIKAFVDEIKTQINQANG